VFGGLWFIDGFVLVGWCFCFGNCCLVYVWFGLLWVCVGWRVVLCMYFGCWGVVGVIGDYLYLYDSVFVVRLCS